MVSTHLWKTIVPIWRQKSFPPKVLRSTKKIMQSDQEASSIRLDSFRLFSSFVPSSDLNQCHWPLAHPCFSSSTPVTYGDGWSMVHFCWNEEFLGIFGWQLYEHEDASWAWLDIMSMTENREKTSWTWERKINHFELISNVFFHTVTVSHKIRRWPTLWPMII